MLSSAQLAAFQGASQAAGDQSIEIQRETPTSDGMGGSTLAWSTVTTVMGNLAQPTGGLMQNYGYIVDPESTWMARLPVGTNVLENDRLISGGQTIRVQVILQPQSYQTGLRVLGAEIKRSGIN